ncbi:MAG: hypothetical protein AAGE93_15825 [Bacteroidota bacterium]
MKALLGILALVLLFACNPDQVNPNQPNQATDRIAGSVLHIYTPASIFSSYGGAYSRLDFCPGGHFVNFSEVSLHVEGGPYDYNTGQYVSEVDIASTNQYTGTWKIEEAQGQSYLVLYYRDGSTAIYELNLVMDGSWQRGKTEFAMEWNKGQCR